MDIAIKRRRIIVIGLSGHLRALSSIVTNACSVILSIMQIVAARPSKLCHGLQLHKVLHVYIISMNNIAYIHVYRLYTSVSIEYRRKEMMKRGSERERVREL